MGKNKLKTKYFILLTEKNVDNEFYYQSAFGIV